MTKPFIPSSQLPHNLRQAKKAITPLNRNVVNKIGPLSSVDEMRGLREALARRKQQQATGSPLGGAGSTTPPQSPVRTPVTTPLGTPVIHPVGRSGRKGSSSPPKSTDWTPRSTPPFNPADTGGGEGSSSPIRFPNVPPFGNLEEDTFLSSNEPTPQNSPSVNSDGGTWSGYSSRHGFGSPRDEFHVDDEEEIREWHLDEDYRSSHNGTPVHEGSRPFQDESNTGFPERDSNNHSPTHEDFLSEGINRRRQTAWSSQSTSEAGTEPSDSPLRKPADTEPSNAPLQQQPVDTTSTVNSPIPPTPPPLPPTTQFPNATTSASNPKPAFLSDINGNENLLKGLKKVPVRRDRSAPVLQSDSKPTGSMVDVASKFKDEESDGLSDTDSDFEAKPVPVRPPKTNFARHGSVRRQTVPSNPSDPEKRTNTQFVSSRRPSVRRPKYSPFTQKPPASMQTGKPGESSLPSLSKTTAESSSTGLPATASKSSAAEGSESIPDDMSQQKGKKPSYENLEENTPKTDSIMASLYEEIEDAFPGLKGEDAETISDTHPNLEQGTVGTEAQKSNLRRKASVRRKKAPRIQVPVTLTETPPDPTIPTTQLAGSRVRTGRKPPISSLARKPLASEQKNTAAADQSLASLSEADLYSLAQNAFKRQSSLRRGPSIRSSHGATVVPTSMKDRIAKFQAPASGNDSSGAGIRKNPSQRKGKPWVPKNPPLNQGASPSTSSPLPSTKPDFFPSIVNMHANASTSTSDPLQGKWDGAVQEDFDMSGNPITEEPRTVQESIALFDANLQKRLSQKRPNRPPVQTTRPGDLQNKSPKPSVGPAAGDDDVAEKMIQFQKDHSRPDQTDYLGRAPDSTFASSSTDADGFPLNRASSTSPPLHHPVPHHISTVPTMDTRRLPDFLTSDTSAIPSRPSSTGRFSEWPSGLDSFGENQFSGFPGFPVNEHGFLERPRSGASEESHWPNDDGAPSDLSLKLSKIGDRFKDGRDGITSLASGVIHRRPSRKQEGFQFLRNAVQRRRPRAPIPEEAPLLNPPAYPTPDNKGSFFDGLSGSYRRHRTE